MQVAAEHGLKFENLLHPDDPRYQPIQKPSKPHKVRMDGRGRPARPKVRFYGPRAPHIKQVRWLAFHRVRAEAKMSFPEIGRLFGGYDHTSVMHGIRKIEEQLAVKEAA